MGRKRGGVLSLQDHRVIHSAFHPSQSDAQAFLSIPFHSLHLPTSFYVFQQVFFLLGSSLQNNGFWILQMCSVHCSLLFLITSTILGFWYNYSNSSLFFLILQQLVTLSFTGPNIFLRIFFSKTRNLLSSVFQIAQISALYVIIDLTEVVYSYFIKFLDKDQAPNSFTSPKKHLFSVWILTSISFHCFLIKSFPST